MALPLLPLFLLLLLLLFLLLLLPAFALFCRGFWRWARLKAATTWNSQYPPPSTLLTGIVHGLPSLRVPLQRA